MNESDTTFVVNGSRIAEKINHVDVLQNGIETNEVVVCPSSDMIVKNFETYILLLNLLRPNALEIVTGLVTTFELYVNAIMFLDLKGLDICCSYLIHSPKVRQ